MNTARLKKLDSVTLLHGSHKTYEAGMCAMEAVAWLAGEPHSDAPKCACPTITRAMQKLNDRISDDALRTELLRPVLPKIIGTRAPWEVMVKRAWIAADAACRVFAPIAIEAHGNKDLADKLRGLPIVDSRPAAEAARSLLKPAADAAAAYADAAAYAYAAAYAAYADADAYAAAYAAADAAYAAADADAYAAKQKSVYLKAVEMVERMIAVTA